MISVYADGKWLGIIVQDTPQERAWWASRAHHVGYKVSFR